MRKSWQVVVPLPPSGLRRNAGTHGIGWHAKSAKYAEEVGWAILRQYPRPSLPHFQRGTIHLTAVFPADHHVWDATAVVEAFKGGQDMIVQLGILPDDGWANLQSGGVRCIVISGQRYLRVTITDAWDQRHEPPLTPQERAALPVPARRRSVGKKKETPHVIPLRNGQGAGGSRSRKAG